MIQNRVKKRNNSKKKKIEKSVKNDRQKRITMLSIIKSTKMNSKTQMYHKRCMKYSQRNKRHWNWNNCRKSLIYCLMWMRIRARKSRQLSKRDRSKKMKKKDLKKNEKMTIFNVCERATRNRVDVFFSIEKTSNLIASTSWLKWH